MRGSMPATARATEQGPQPGREPGPASPRSASASGSASPGRPAGIRPRARTRRAARTPLPGRAARAGRPALIPAVIPPVIPAVIPAVLAAVLVAAAALLGPTLGPLPSATAATAAATPTATAPSVRLVSAGVVVVPGSRQRITVDVADLPSGDTDWELAVTVRSAATEARLLDAFAGRARGSVVDVRRFPVTAPGRQTIDLPIGDCDTCVPLRRAGVHPVLIELRRPGADTVADAFSLAIVVSDPSTPPPGPPVDLALVVRLHRPPAVTADGADAPLDLRGFVEATEALARHPGLGLTVVVTPETLESIERQGGGGGILDTLRGALDGRTLVADGYVRWREGVLESTAVAAELRRQRDRAEAVVDRLGLDALTDVAVLDRGPIPSAAALERAGISQLVVPADAVSLPDEAIEGPVVVDVGAADRVDAPALGAVVTDPVLTAALEPPGRETDAVLAANHLSALLAVRRAQGEGGLAALVLPETFSPGLNALLDAVEALRTTSAVPAAAAVAAGLASPGPAGGLAPVRIDDVLTRPGNPTIATPVLTGARPVLATAEAEEVAGLRRQIDGVAALTGDTEVVEGLERRLAVTLAADLTGDPDTYRQGLRAELRRDLFVVDLVPGGSYG